MFSIKLVIRIFNNILEHILNIFFPPKCLSCDIAILTHNTLCESCWKKCHFITNPKCEKCGMPFLEGSFEACNLSCIHKNQLYTSSYSVFLYESVIISMIYKLKYGNCHEANIFFAKLMYNNFATFIRNADLIIPIPMHSLKQRERKYNQAARLAIKIAKYLKISYRDNILLKIRNTSSQMLLSEKLRQTNIIGSFAVSELYINQIHDKVIVLIDDVLTTGSTVNECTKVLLAAGAKQVLVLTIAKTMKQIP